MKSFYSYTFALSCLTNTLDELAASGRRGFAEFARFCFGSCYLLGFNILQIINSHFSLPKSISFESQI